MYVGGLGYVAIDLGVDRLPHGRCAGGGHWRPCPARAIRQAIHRPANVIDPVYGLPYLPIHTHTFVEQYNA